MDYDVLEARYVRDHVVWLRFRDGTSGEIDLSSSMRGPVFEPLRDAQVFRHFFVHPEFATLAWPNDVDLAPEFLHERVRMADSPTAAERSIGEHPTSQTAASDSRAISQAFFGIVVSMFYDEHGRPHFHARTGEFEVSFEIEREIVRGEFPATSLHLVTDWARLHRDELLANWNRARRGEPLLPIQPLK